MVLPQGAFEWIDTGDPMPAGTDTVIERERVVPRDDGGVLVTGRAGGDLAPHGRNVRAAAEDFAAGELLVPAGRRLRPADLAAAVAGGHVTLAVARRPAVAIIPTGDEIRPVGAALRRGDFTDTNSLMLAARCLQAGARPAVSAVQPDDPDTLAAEIRRSAADADLVLVIAGSSRGRGDHTAAVLAQVGGVAVAGAALRPGHPVLLGHAKPGDGSDGIVPVVGVPGYPLAAAVICELFALPLLAAIGGWRHAPDTRPAVLDRDWASPARRRGMGPGPADPLRGPRRGDARQARRGLGQPPRPRRRLVADPARPGPLPGRHRDRGPPDPWRLLRLMALSAPLLRGAAGPPAASCCYHMASHPQPRLPAWGQIPSTNPKQPLAGFRVPDVMDSRGTGDAWCRLPLDTILPIAQSACSIGTCQYPSTPLRN